MRIPETEPEPGPDWTADPVLAEKNKEKLAELLGSFGRGNLEPATTFDDEVAL